MLQLAVKAKIPLIAIRTRDTINVMTVLEHLLKTKPLDVEKQDKLAPDKVYYRIIPRGFQDKQDYGKLYTQMAKLHSVLIVINPASMHDAMFDMGELPIPKELKKKFLSPLVMPDGANPKEKAAAEAKVEAMTGALGGCTIKESLELTLMTMARDASITPVGLMQTRKQVFQGSQGLTQIDTSQPYYKASNTLESWIAKKKALFFGAPDPRLMPRGLLFDGPPGTGKTEGAKYLANQFGCPLFRIDVSSTKNKYVGESSANLNAAISRIDAEEPCIVLIDEVEKVFSQKSNDSSGVTTDMLSQVLWWLAEHKTRVLTVMTTNKKDVLPKELYREGRIDQVMFFGGMEMGAATVFAEGLAKTFKIKELDPKEIAKEAVNHAFDHTTLKTDPPTVAAAGVTEAVKDVIANKLAG